MSTTHLLGRVGLFGLGLLLLAAAPAAAEKRRAFATSVSGSGDLGSWSDSGGRTGLAAGDAICRARARAAGLPNHDAYRAWLSSSTVDAYCHVQGLTGKKSDACGNASLPGAGPWYLVDGTTPFTAALDQLTGPPWKILQPVFFDEFGNEILDSSDGFLWTGTSSAGRAVAQTCDDWVDGTISFDGAIGEALGSGQVWTYWAPQRDCSRATRLLCLEPGPSDAPAPPDWSPAALVFVTSKIGNGNLATWPGSGNAPGLAGGDAVCASLAAAAHLPAPESFVAWLSDVSVSAASRLTLTDAPYRRPDGELVAIDKADLLDGTTSSSIHVLEDGTYLTGYFDEVWTGTVGSGGSWFETCDDWSSSGFTSSAAFGFADLGGSDEWTDYSVTSCDREYRLYCFSNVVTLFWDGFDRTGDTSRWSSSLQ